MKTGSMEVGKHESEKEARKKVDENLLEFVVKLRTVEYAALTMMRKLEHFLIVMTRCKLMIKIEMISYVESNGNSKGDDLEEN